MYVFVHPTWDKDMVRGQVSPSADQAFYPVESSETMQRPFSPYPDVVKISMLQNCWLWSSGYPFIASWSLLVYNVVISPAKGA